MPGGEGNLMAESVHSLATCRMPLSAVTQYYRRSLVVAPVRTASAATVFERRYSVNVAVDGVPRESVVAVAEFAAHVAFLEPVTGIGLLVAPSADTDVMAPDDWSLEGASAGARYAYGRTGGLSLQAADRVHALKQLERAGWGLLESDQGVIEDAGRASDGRPAACLWAPPVCGRELVLEDLQRAITALHMVADLRHD